MADTPTTQSTQPAPKKKLPTWVKVIIVLAILGFGLMTVIGIGLKMFAGFIQSKSGVELTQKGIEKMIEKGIENASGGKADVKLDEEGIVVKDKESGQEIAIGTSQQLPAGFPSDIPIFVPSTINGSMAMGILTMVTLESPSAIQDISDYYKKQMAERGWTPTYISTPSPQIFSGLYKKENRQLTLNVSGEGGKSTFVLSYGLEP